MTDELFAVSGWEDDIRDIDISRNPSDKLERDILNACEKGNLDLVRTIIQSNPYVINAVDKDGYTPLHRACYNNNVEMVKFLLQNGANISAVTELEWQPLHSCCQWNNKECAAVLIQQGADVNAKSQGGQTPLHIAASHGASFETVQLLLMHPFIDPTIKNNSGETAKDIATRSSRYYNIFEMTDPLLDLDSAKKLK